MAYSTFESHTWTEMPQCYVWSRPKRRDSGHASSSLIGEQPMLRFFGLVSKLLSSALARIWLWFSIRNDRDVRLGFVLHTDCSNWMSQNRMVRSSFHFYSCARSFSRGCARLTRRKMLFLWSHRSMHRHSAGSTLGFSMSRLRKGRILSIVQGALHSVSTSRN